MTTETLILDSVTHLTGEARGRIAVCASHGGIYAAIYAAAHGVSALILNDAGVGMGRAGVAGVLHPALSTIATAAISHESARIGDGSDMAARGILSIVNDKAASLGLKPGMRVGSAVAVLESHGQFAPASVAPPGPESESEAPSPAGGGRRVFLLDSTGLVSARHVGHVVVTGSHGGLLGGRPASAVKADVFAAIFNDADRGADRAGLSRLPALEARAIAGATVSAFSARIGEARSTYASGVISAVNERAAALGGAVGQTTREFLAAILAADAGRAA